jgi:hypothetical protein
MLEFPSICHPLKMALLTSVETSSLVSFRSECLLSFQHLLSRISPPFLYYSIRLCLFVVALGSNLFLSLASSACDFLPFDLTSKVRHMYRSNSIPSRVSRASRFASFCKALISYSQRCVRLDLISHPFFRFPFSASIIPRSILGLFV